MISYPRRSKHEEFIGTKVGFVEVIEFSHLEEKKNRFAYFYKFKCKCGNTGVARKDFLLLSLRNEKKKSNPTYCCESCRKDKLSEWAKKACVRYTDPVEGKCSILFSNYRTKCKKKKWDFLLTFSEFKKLVTSNCFYCSMPPNKCRIDRAKSRSGIGLSRIFFNGIDRIDSTKGYFLENCVPCCEDCNKGKRNLSVDQFLNMVKSIYENLKLENFKNVDNI